MFNRSVPKGPSLALYRSCLRAIKQLEPQFQKTYYDYVRLKYDELKDEKNRDIIKRAIEDGREQLDWLNTIFERKKQLKEKSKVNPFASSISTSPSSPSSSSI